MHIPRWLFLLWVIFTAGGWGGTILTVIELYEEANNLQWVYNISYNPMAGSVLNFMLGSSVVIAIWIIEQRRGN